MAKTTIECIIFVHAKSNCQPIKTSKTLSMNLVELLEAATGQCTIFNMTIYGIDHDLRILVQFISSS